jgi:plasmid stabilization system protein ParE
MATVRLAAPAARQLRNARDWWLANRDKAPHAFDQDIAALWGVLEDRPELVGRPLEGQPSVRRVHLQRIRYYVYFQLADDGDGVQILALWHERRGSAPKF